MARKGGIQQQLLRSHLFLGMLGVLMLLLGLGAFLWLVKNTTRLAVTRGPTALSSTQVLGGVHESLAALRGWIVLGRQEDRAALRKVWTDQINRGVLQLESLADNWTDPANVQRLEQAKLLLTDLKEQQWWAEQVAMTPGNQPALVSNELDVEPITSRLSEGITQMIELESRRAIGLDSSTLKTMADLRYDLASSREALSKFAANGDESAEQQFRTLVASVRLRLDELSSEPLLTDTQREILNWMPGEIAAYITLATELVEIRRGEQWNRALHILAKQIYPIETKLTSVLTAMSRSQVDLMQSDEKRVVLISRVGIVITTLLILVMSFAAYALSVRRARQFTEPLHRLVRATQKMAAGTLDSDIEVMSADEFGHLTTCFNDMRKAREQNEQQLKEYARELERSNLELQQFAYVASHDLQEPLRMVGSYCQLLEKRYKAQLDEQASRWLNYAVDGANRMKRLVNDLLHYSRVESRAKAFEPVELNQVCADAIRNLESSIRDTETAIEVESLPKLVGDGTQLVQLFQNLIGNAIKFRGAEKPLIRISASEAEGEWKVCVADNGIGIDGEFRQRIFEIFKRLHHKEKYPGTGIGLAVCRRVVERHGGRIWVECEPGEGCRFFFTLPRK